MILTVNAVTGEVTQTENSAPSLPLPAPPQVTTLTFAQLMTGLVTEGWITEAEGDAWLVGVLPAPVLALIATMPVEQRFETKAKATRFLTAALDDPIVQTLADAQNKLEELPAFFNTYGSV